MLTFTDYYHNQVELSFTHYPFSDKPLHVWVVARYGDKWVLTKHKQRGLEFPGGKVEPGEHEDDAAIREVFEETGGIVKSLHYLGQYRVLGRGDTVIKNIYFAVIDRFEDHPAVEETDGAVLLDELPKNLLRNNQYSFMMKDRVLPETMKVLHAKNMV